MSAVSFLGLRILSGFAPVRLRFGALLLLQTLDKLHYHMRRRLRQFI